MEYIKDIFTNHIILVPVIAWAISQIAKVFTHAIVNREFVIKKILADGGMPSAHAATVTSAATMCGLTVGFDSVVFGIATIFVAVILRDAVGVRRETAKNARKLKEAADRINEKLTEEEKIDTSKIKLTGGHTTPEVVAGVILGVIVAILYNLIAL